jgi:WD40-like Beta Propeller Repeat
MGKDVSQILRVLTAVLVCVGVLFAVTCSAALPQSDTRARVQEKVRQVQETFPKWVKAGGNQRRLEPLTKELDGHMNAGRLVEAEKVLDRILAILRNEDTSSPTAAAADESVVERVQRKAKEFDAKAPVWASSGGDPNRIRPLAERLDVFLKAGQPDKAEPILDQLLAIVNEAPAASRATSKPVPRATAKQVRLSKIPDNAKIVFHDKEMIYVMDANGGNITPITFDRGRHYEHVAVSPDRKYIVANYFLDPSRGGQSSALVLFDLDAGMERPLVPNFVMAGNGGVDWDRNGNIYFAGVERLPFDQPKGRDEFIANAGANDVYRVKYDGTGLTRLTNTSDRGEADVSVSPDGTHIAYMATYINPPNDTTEIWINSADGNAPRLVYKGGKMGVTSVHDPEISPDGSEIIFSKVNPDFKNFKSDPGANTAHDLYRIRLDGSQLTRVTQPGPISVIPDWMGNQVLFLLLTDRESTPYRGIAVINSDGTGLHRINSSANIAKWIPDAR